LFKGRQAHDDALLVTMPDGSLLASTVDVFTPVVDDPYLYGQVAAANSMSDIYAMGGRPRFALSILGYQPDLLSPETAARIIQGAIDKAWEGGVVLGGGHTIKTGEVIFGLAVVGDFPDGIVMEKGGARPGDVLVVTKPLGTGVMTTAIKRQMLSEQEVATVVGWMSVLNDKASQIAAELGVISCTDVTGFGFLGHLLEMVEASGVAVTVYADSVPMIDGTRQLAAQSIVSGGSLDNLEFVSARTRFAESVTYDTRVLLADAQTSGGLLIAVPGKSLDRFQHACSEAGQFCAVVGAFEQGESIISVI